MNDVLDGVRDHYRATGLTERLKTALMARGPPSPNLGVWGRTLRSFPPTWDEISWEAGSAF